MPMERLHIAFFGPANSGKSTLVNALCGQEVSLVSPHPGTTTDPVRKTVELPGLGACVLIDTAGLDDESFLGPERRRRTLAVLDEDTVARIFAATHYKICCNGVFAVLAPSNHDAASGIRGAGKFCC